MTVHSSIRRECTDHVVVVGKGHLRSVLRECVEYYNRCRCHTALGGNAPIPGEVEGGHGPVHAVAYLGGLHHRYSCAA